MLRPTRPRALLALLLMLLLPLAGCATKEITVALQTATTTLKDVDDAREAHKISDKTWTETIVPARTATKTLFDQIQDDFLNSRTFDWRTAIKNLYAAMAPLVRQQQLLKGSVTP